ncbi:MAG: nitroreductase family protein [Flavobacteriales bacterium]
MDNRSHLPIHPVLGARYSPRAFRSAPIPRDEQELLFEAARWSASSMNEQPWRFLVTERGGEGHAELLAALAPSNARWADKAALLVLAMVNRSFARNGQLNHHAWHDLGNAVAQLTAQATALGIGVHQLGGFSSDMARAAFGIPEGLDLVSVLALGYPDGSSVLPEDLRAREEQRSMRKPLDELVLRGRFH